MLTQERLKELFHYDLDSGSFIRLIRRGHCHAGTIAGSAHKDGYAHIFVARKNYLAHRLAWLYVTGAFPIKHIDHIDGNRGNNAFCNLREASHSENGMNRKRSSANKSGFKGVYFNVGIPSKPWRVTCKVNGRTSFIGNFITPEEAHEAYKAFAKIHHGEFFNAG